MTFYFNGKAAETKKQKEEKTNTGRLKRYNSLRKIEVKDLNILERASYKR